MAKKCEMDIIQYWNREIIPKLSFSAQIKLQCINNFFLFRSKNLRSVLLRFLTQTSLTLILEKRINSSLNLIRCGSVPSQLDSSWDDRILATVWVESCSLICSKLQGRVFLVFKEYYYNEIRILYHPPSVVTDAELIPTDPLQEGGSW